MISRRKDKIFVDEGLEKVQCIKDGQATLMSFQLDAPKNLQTTFMGFSQGDYASKGCGNDLFIMRRIYSFISSITYV